MLRWCQTTPSLTPHRGSPGGSILFADADGATKIGDVELLETALRHAARHTNDLRSAPVSTASVPQARAELLGFALGSRAHLEVGRWLVCVGGRERGRGGVKIDGAACIVCVEPANWLVESRECRVHHL